MANTAVSTKKTKKIAKKQAKKQVNKLAPGIAQEIAQEQIEALAVPNDKVVRINESLSFGQQTLLAQNGPVSLTADCRQNSGAGQNEIRILAATTQNSAFLDGEDNHQGPGGSPPDNTFLNTNTLADNRELADEETTTAGQADVDNDIDDGFVAGPDGSYVGLDGETVALGLNAFGANCSVKGLAVLIP